jgi:hypothetical protein
MSLRLILPVNKCPVAWSGSGCHLVALYDCLVAARDGCRSHTWVKFSLVCSTASASGRHLSCWSAISLAAASLQGSPLCMQCMALGSHTIRPPILVAVQSAGGDVGLTPVNLLTSSKRKWSETEPFLVLPDPCTRRSKTRLDTTLDNFGTSRPISLPFWP